MEGEAPELGQQPTIQESGARSKVGFHERHAFVPFDPSGCQGFGSEGKENGEVDRSDIKNIGITTISLEFKHFLIQIPGLIGNQVSICLV